jgi:GDP-L-fucose synthase
MDLQGVSNFKTLVLSNLYGKYDNFSLRNGHAVAAAFTKVLEAKRNNSNIVEIWGSGKPRREFTLAKDVAKFVLNSVSHLDTFPSVLNLGCGRDYSINEIYEIVSKALSYPVEFKHNRLKPDGVLSKLMDSSIAMKDHHWTPEINLDKGLLTELIPNLGLIEQ